MKTFSFFVVLITILLPLKPTQHAGQTIEIVKIDSIKEYYIFYGLKSCKDTVYILGNKHKISSCQPFKRYVILDSVKESLDFEYGNRVAVIQSRAFFYDGKKINNAGELLKYIDNCSAFSDRE